MYPYIRHTKKYKYFICCNWSKWGLGFVMDFRPPFAGIEYRWKLEMQFLCLDIIIGKWKQK